jgi:hypothetical protein
VSVDTKRARELAGLLVELFQPASGQQKDEASEMLQSLAAEVDALRAERALLVQVEICAQMLLEATGDIASETDPSDAWRSLHDALTALDEAVARERGGEPAKERERGEVNLNYLRHPIGLAVLSMCGDLSMCRTRADVRLVRAHWALAEAHFQRKLQRIGKRRLGKEGQSITGLSTRGAVWEVWLGRAQQALAEWRE